MWKKKKKIIHADPGCTKCRKCSTVLLWSTWEHAKNVWGHMWEKVPHYSRKDIVIISRRWKRNTEVGTTLEGKGFGYDRISIQIIEQVEEGDHILIGLSQYRRFTDRISCGVTFKMGDISRFFKTKSPPPFLNAQFFNYRSTSGVG